MDAQNYWKSKSRCTEWKALDKLRIHSSNTYLLTYLFNMSRYFSYSLKNFSTLTTNYIIIRYKSLYPHNALVRTQRVNLESDGSLEGEISYVRVRWFKSWKSLSIPRFSLFLPDAFFSITQGKVAVIKKGTKRIDRTVVDAFRSPLLTSCRVGKPVGVGARSGPSWILTKSLYYFPISGTKVRPVY